MDELKELTRPGQKFTEDFCRQLAANRYEPGDPSPIRVAFLEGDYYVTEVYPSDLPWKQWDARTREMTQTEAREVADLVMDRRSSLHPIGHVVGHSGLRVRGYVNRGKGWVNSVERVEDERDERQGETG